jgi:hypothetical protein
MVIETGIRRMKHLQIRYLLLYRYPIQLSIIDNQIIGEMTHDKR